MSYFEMNPYCSEEGIRFSPKQFFFHNPGDVDYRIFSGQPIFGLANRGTLEIGTVFEKGINLVVMIPKLLQGAYLAEPVWSAFEPIPREGMSKSLKCKPPRSLLPQANKYLENVRRKIPGNDLSNRIDCEAITAADIRYLPNVFIVAAIEARGLEHNKIQPKVNDIRMLPFKKTLLKEGDIFWAINYHLSHLR